ncbi:MAG: RNA-binding protein [Candidatus Methanomethylophilaceae archaeon]|jgi:PUA domain protein
MADIRVRKRKRMREKDVKALKEQMTEIFCIKTFDESDAVDLAESPDFNLIFVNNDVLGIIYQEKPFLTVRGILKYKPQARAVTVDMGAVPYVTNGADVMGPGIVDVDPNIKEGDFVWIRDAKNQVPLAIGISLRSATGLMEKEKGKAISTIHNVGDKLWKSGE